MANPAGPLLPLSSVKDSELRRVLEPLINGWRVRNGELGNGDEQFLTKKDLMGIVQGDPDFLAFARDSLGITGIEQNGGGFPEIGGLTAGQVLDLLAGQITESQLFRDLGERIDLIDAPENVVNSVNNRLLERTREVAGLVQDEADARIAANTMLAQDLADTATNLANDIFNEAIARDNAIVEARDGLTAVISGETAARIEGDRAVTESVLQLASRTDGAIAGVSDRINTTAAAGEATATRVSQLTVRVDDNAAAIINESTTRATSDSVLAQQISSSVATLGDQIAAVRSTSEANATQLETVARQLEEIIVVDGGQAAAIEMERVARIAGDEALASEITSLSARTDKNSADIVTESEARTTADSAFTSQLNALTTRVGESEAAIIDERNARSGADNSLAQSVTTLTARVGTTEAAVLSEQTARVQGDSANASEINGLSLRTDNIAADLTNFKTVTADQFTATLQQVDQKIVSFNNNTVQAGFSDERNARINADNAITNSVNSQFSQVNNNLAVVQNRVDTAVNQASAAVSQVNSVQAQLNGVSSTVQSERSARINADNTLFAQYSVKIDSAGVVSGFGLSSTGPTSTPSSAFIVRADKFAIASPSRSGFSNSPSFTELPFVITTTTQNIGGVSVPPGTYIRSTYIQNASIDNAKIQNAAITNAKIQDLAVDTLKIAGDAVTVPLSVAGGTGQIGTSFTTMFTLSSGADSVAKRNVISVNGRTTYAGGEINTARYRLRVLAGATTIYQTGDAPFLAVFFAFSVLHVQPAGSSIVYAVQIAQTGGGTTSSSGNMTILSTKR